MSFLILNKTYIAAGDSFRLTAIDQTASGGETIPYEITGNNLVASHFIGETSLIGNITLDSNGTGFKEFETSVEMPTGEDYFTITFESSGLTDVNLRVYSDEHFDIIDTLEEKIGLGDTFNVWRKKTNGLIARLKSIEESTFESRSQTIIADGVNSSFILNFLTASENEEWYDVNIDGIAQNPLTSFVINVEDNTIEFTEIPPEGASISIIHRFELGGAISYTDGGSGSTGLYDTTLPDGTLSVDVGGIPAGTLASSLKGRTIIEVLDDMIFPTIPATITDTNDVTITISVSESGYQEVGSESSVTLTANYDAGTILSGDGSTTDLTGAVDTYDFDATGYPISPSGSSTETFDFTWVLGNNNFSVDVNYLQGNTPYYDNKGNQLSNLDGSRSPGTLNDSRTLVGVYPVFYYTSPSPISNTDMQTAIANGSASKIVTASNGTISIPYNVNGDYFAVAYPASSTVKTKFYITDLDKGDIEAMFFPVTTLSVNSPDVYWSSINYNIHVTDSALAQNPEPFIELRNA